MTDVPFPLLRTKLRKPLPASSLVPRQRLVDKLSERPDATLTLVVASAGPGKTTAVPQWLEHIRWPVDWLSLDEMDNELAVFPRYLIAAIDTTLPGACTDTARLLHALQPPPANYLIAALVNELSGVTQPFVLVLDDYHPIRDASIHQLVGQLLHHAPPPLHLVVTSRFDPAPAGEPSCGGEQLQMLDVMVFMQWLDAARVNDRPLAQHYRERFRAEFKPAFEAWRKLDPGNNPDTPSPFALPEYAPKRFSDADRAEAEANQAAERFQFANNTDTEYVRNTLFTAMALFFGGIAGRFKYRPARFGMLALAGLMLLIGIGNVILMPKI